MSSVIKKPKFPKFIGLLHERGLDVKRFVDILNNNGYKYKYSSVLKKMNGKSSLNYDDIVAFSETLNVGYEIFFEGQFTFCELGNQRPTFVKEKGA